MTEQDVARRIAERARTVTGVADLTAGPRGRIVTFQAGTPLGGVAVRPDAVEIGIVARPGRRLPDIAADVRAAALPLAGDRAVHVLVGDLAEEGT